MSGLSQEAISQKAGVNREAYGNIEHSARRPSVETAKRIAALLGFQWKQFLRGRVARPRASARRKQSRGQTRSTYTVLEVGG